MAKSPHGAVHGSLTLDDSPRRTSDGESPRRARTIMVQAPLREDAPERPTQSASGRARNVIVAHDPGQTIEKATLSEVSGKPIVDSRSRSPSAAWSSGYPGVSEHPTSSEAMPSYFNTVGTEETCTCSKVMAKENTICISMATLQRAIYDRGSAQGIQNDFLMDRVKKQKSQRAIAQPRRDDRPRRCHAR